MELPCSSLLDLHLGFPAIHAEAVGDPGHLLGARPSAARRTACSAGVTTPATVARPGSAALAGSATAALPGASGTSASVACLGSTAPVAPSGAPPSGAGLASDATIPRVPHRTSPGACAGGATAGTSACLEPPRSLLHLDLEACPRVALAGAGQQDQEGHQRP